MIWWYKAKVIHHALASSESEPFGHGESNDIALPPVPVSQSSQRGLCIGIRGIAAVNNQELRSEMPGNGFYR